MSREKGMNPKRNQTVCGMMSAVLSTVAHQPHWRHPGLHGTAYAGGRGGVVKEREEREKSAILFFKWLISFLSDTKQNFNDETC